MLVGISWFGKGTCKIPADHVLHAFDNGSVNAQRYRQEVLEPYVGLFRGAVSPEFIIMDGNVRAHRVLMVDECMESENIQRYSLT